MRTRVLMMVLLGLSLVHSAEKTILDYYLALDPMIFSCEDQRVTNPSPAWRKKQITLIDLRNGYLQARYDNANGQGPIFEMTVFKDKLRQQDIVAVNRACGEACQCKEFNFQTMDVHGNWHNYKDFPFAKIDEILSKKDVDYDLQLPRFGTEIKVVNSATDKPMMRVQWISGRFVLLEK